MRSNLCFISFLGLLVCWSNVGNCQDQVLSPEAKEIFKLHEEISQLQQQHKFRPALGKLNSLIQKLNVLLTPDHPEILRQKTKRLYFQFELGFPELSMEIRAVIRSFRKHYKNKHPHMEVIDFIEALVVQGQIEVKESHYGQAIRVLDEVMQLVREHKPVRDELVGLALKFRGISQGIQGNFLLAKEDFQSAISIVKPTVKNAPLLGSLYVSLGSQFATEGLLLNRVGKKEEGTKLLEKALGVFAKAETVYSKVPLIIPHMEEAKRNLLLQQGRIRIYLTANPRKGWEEFEKRLSGFLNDPLNVSERARLLSERAAARVFLGEFDKAESDFGEAKRLLLILRKLKIPDTDLESQVEENYWIYLAEFKNQRHKALKLQEDTLNSLLSSIDDLLLDQGTSGRIQFLNSNRRLLDSYINNIIQTKEDPKKLYNFLIAWKGLLFQRTRFDKYMLAAPAVDRDKILPLVRECSEQRCRILEAMRSLRHEELEKDWDNDLGPQIAILEEKERKIQGQISREDAKDKHCRIGTKCR